MAAAVVPGQEVESTRVGPTQVNSALFSAFATILQLNSNHRTAFQVWVDGKIMDGRTVVSRRATDGQTLASRRAADGQTLASHRATYCHPVTETGCHLATETDGQMLVVTFPIHQHPTNVYMNIFFLHQVWVAGKIMDGRTLVYRRATDGRTLASRRAADGPMVSHRTTDGRMATETDGRTVEVCSTVAHGSL